MTTLTIALLWRIIAAVDYLFGEDAIYRVLEGESLPDKYRGYGVHCDHCHTNRARKTVYILLSSDGEYKQVGSTCLFDFTGQNAGELTRVFHDQLDADEDERIRQSRMFSLSDYLVRVAVVIRETGWLSATKAREIGRTPTAEYAISWKGEAIEADVITANATIAWAQSLPDDETNDYLHNLHVLAGQRAIEPKHRNLAASMIIAHQSAQAREAESAKTAASVHFGTIGKREIFTLAVDRVTAIEGHYGVTHVHTMHDASGNVATWFCSGVPLDIGATVTIKATVKAHGEYKGIAQTVLTRCQPM